MHFCIVGTGRCGTSLLRNIFNHHPDIFVFNETHWIIKMYEMYGTGLADIDRLIDVIHSTYHISEELVTQIDEKNMPSLFEANTKITVKKFCDTIGKQYAKENHKKIWADKTPDYGPFMHIIQHLWPQCKFIHIIRHGADVAHSMSKHPGYQWLASAKEDSWATVAYNKYFKSVKIQKQPIEIYSALWYRRLKRIQTEATLLNDQSYIEIHFEDLFQNLEYCLPALSDFVHLDYDSKWIHKSLQLIEPDRIKNRNVTSDFMNEQELNLLAALGY